MVSDGWGGIKQAMIAVYGQVSPYQGRGRRPTKKREVDGWQYLQVVKQRDTHGRFLGTALRVIFGKDDDVLALLGKSTSYIERTHLTMRHMNGRLVGKGLGFSKRLGLHKAQAAWEDLVYNVVRPLKTLRPCAPPSPTRPGSPAPPAPGPAKESSPRRRVARSAGSPLPQPTRRRD